MNPEERFRVEVDQAREHLRQQMTERGMKQVDGWRISESVRETDGGSQLVLRPIHMRLEPPDDLACYIWIGRDHGEVGTRCSP